MVAGELSPKQATSPTSVKRRKKRNNSWLVLACVLAISTATLAVLWISNVFSPGVNSVSKAEQSIPSSPSSTEVPATSPPPADPRSEHFRLVNTPDIPWLPPAVPKPINLEFLPPGAQAILIVRPSQILANAVTNSLINILNQDDRWQGWCSAITSQTGVSLDKIQQLVIGFYAPSNVDEIPNVAIRVELKQPMDISQLKSTWKATKQSVVNEMTIHESETGIAYCVRSPQLFTLSSRELVDEIVEFNGAAGPLSVEMKKLIRQSNADFDFALLASPRFLYSDGKRLVQSLSGPMRQWIESTLHRDARGLLVQSHVGDKWYWEMQVIGAADSSSLNLAKELDVQATAASARSEEWLVASSPHPYWRTLAVRYPQMLRAWRQNSRFGVEDGVAVANGYLPKEAAPNLIAAFWISMQEGAFD